MSAYWDWWWGALALAAIAVLHQLVVGRRLGVSGAWERVVHWRQEREVERLDAQFDESAFEAALLDALSEVPVGAAAPRTAAVSSEHIETSPRTDAVAPSEARVPVAAQLVFLLAMAVGGFVGSLASGRFELRTDMGAAFSDVVVGGPWMWPVLFVGGVLVGFGTRLAGGCSSGHGLSGCGRLQPVSMVATAVFFGTAVAVSMLLWKVI